MRKRLLKIERRAKLERRRRREAELYEKRKLESMPEVGEEWGPGIDGVPRDIFYDDRGPSDVVISGPLGKKVDGEKSPGRWFATGYDALVWAEEKYGRERVRLIFPKEGMEGVRWAVLVKNLRK